MPNHTDTEHEALEVAGGMEEVIGEIQRLPATLDAEEEAGRERRRRISPDVRTRALVANRLFKSRTRRRDLPGLGTVEEPLPRLRVTMDGVPTRQHPKKENGASREEVQKRLPGQEPADLLPDTAGDRVAQEESSVPRSRIPWRRSPPAARRKARSPASAGRS